MRATTLGLVIGVGLGACAPAAQQSCDYACVDSVVREYVAHMVRHDPAGVPFSEDVRLTENGEDVAIGQGVWQTITEQGAYHQVLVDDGLQDAVFYGAFREGDEPLLLAIRLKVVEGRITEVESLVSRYDERNRLIARHQLTEPNPVYDTALPPDERLSREQLIAAADAYFDGIAESNDADVPLHPECNRRENGVTLLQNPNPESERCPAHFERFNYITAIRDRRVAVVSEANGLVLMWAFFDVPGNVEVAPRSSAPSDAASPDGTPAVDTRRIPRSLYIAELFHVEDGLIRDIEAIMFNLDLGAKSGWE